MVRVAGIAGYFLKGQLSVLGIKVMLQIVNQRVHELCYIVHGTVQQSMPETNITLNLLINLCIFPFLAPMYADMGVHEYMYMCMSCAYVWGPEANTTTGVFMCVLG